MRTSVYRHFSETGLLLYVGVSLSVVSRLMQHSSTSHWFEDIGYITVEYFETRRDAFYAEKLAIRSENPLYNKTYAVQAFEEEYEPIVWTEEEETELAEFDAKYAGMTNEQVSKDMFNGYKAQLLAMIDEADPSIKIRVEQMNQKKLADMLVNYQQML